MRKLSAVLALISIFTIGSAKAEVAESAPGAFLLHYEAVVETSPELGYRALAQLPRWWNPEHSYSGEARRMSLDLRAGGCFCERWDGNSVEHARVLLVMAHEGARTVRLDGALGPLQELGVNAIWTFTISPDPDGAKMSMTYRVTGDPSLSLNNIATPVDGVLQEQFDRFIRYTAS